MDPVEKPTQPSLTGMKNSSEASSDRGDVQSHLGGTSRRVIQVCYWPHDLYDYVTSLTLILT